MYRCSRLLFASVIRVLLLLLPLRPLQCPAVAAAADVISPGKGAAVCADGRTIWPVIHIKLDHPAAHAQAALYGGGACKQCATAVTVASHLAAEGVNSKQPSMNDTTACAATIITNPGHQVTEISCCCCCCSCGCAGHPDVPCCVLSKVMDIRI